jgi:hypothetical protein
MESQEGTGGGRLQGRPTKRLRMACGDWSDGRVVAGEESALEDLDKKFQMGPFPSRSALAFLYHIQV